MAEVTRRQFLKRVGLGAVGLVFAPLLDACAPQLQRDRKTALTAAEEDITRSLSAYNEARKHQDVSYRAAVTIAQHSLEGNPLADILEKYDKIKPSNQSIFADYGLVAELAYGATRYRFDPKTVIGLFETAKANFTLETKALCDIATLAMAYNGDVKKVQNLFRDLANDDSLKFAGITTNFDTVATLTSAGLVAGKERVFDEFRKIKSSQTIWSTDRSAATLTLASILTGRDTKRVLDIYSKTQQHNFKTLLGIRVISEDSMASLALAGTIGKYRIEDVLEMYEFATKNGVGDTDTASRLVLATAAKDAKRPIVSRASSYSIGRITYAVTPIALT